MSAPDSRAQVIYVLEKFPSDTLNFVYNEIRVLEQCGYMVDVFSLLPGGLCPREASEFADRTKTVGRISVFRSLRALVYYMIRKPAVVCQLFWRLPFDVDENRMAKAPRIVSQILVGMHFAWLLRGRDHHVHAHFAFKAATAALVAARLNDVSFSFTSHGTDTVVPSRRFCLRSKVRQSRFVIAVSEFNRGVLLGLCPGSPGEKVIVNRTGVLLDQFYPRQHEPDTTDGFRVVCVASLYPVKNHEGLLRACGELLQRGVDFRLDLAGKDVDGARMQLAGVAAEVGIADRVRWLGVVDHGEVASLLAEAHVCILTSFSEGIPVSLMEAMASGVPVIGPRVTGVPELVEEGISGILVNPRDQREIVDALEKLARNPDLRRNFSEAGRRRIEEAYDMRANAMQLAGVFRRLLDEG